MKSVIVRNRWAICVLLLGLGVVLFGLNGCFSSLPAWIAVLGKILTLPFFIVISYYKGDGYAASWEGVHNIIISLTAIIAQCGFFACIGHVFDRLRWRRTYF